MANYNSSQYIPSFIKAAVSGDGQVEVLKFADISDSNIANEDSFAYNIEGKGLKSTQQLNVDWSKFENHTFFMSAEAKVNLAFEQIINGYPFDGTRQELENFFTNLSGYDKWIFDQFPKFKGQLLFSGTLMSETTPDKGTYIVVKDVPGAIFPSLSPNVTDISSVLNPKNDSSLSIECQLFVPTIATSGTQILLQKINSISNQGFSIRLNPVVSTTTAQIQFDVFVGSSAMTAVCDIPKGVFNHLCFVYNREASLPRLEIYNNLTLATTSTTSAFFNSFDIDYSDLVIGSGSQYVVNTAIVTPQMTLSGVLDELRVFHSIRTVAQQKSYAKKSIYSTPDLKLYFRFNEPPPPLSPISDDIINSIVLDSSGNSLHSYVANFKSELRQNAEEDDASNMIYEKDMFCPILFPANPDVVSLNNSLLSSATEYDVENPNLITKLIPRHYLLEGAAQEGLSSAEQNSDSPYGGDGPGLGRLNNVQLMLSLLYIWAKFFDEIRLFVDAFSTLRNVEYDVNQSVPNNFLFDIVKSYGLFLPPLLNKSTIEQYVSGENIDPLIKGNESLSLRSVQHELLRRIIINIPSVIKSKGTQHSIKSFLRSVGIDPDSSMRFREYGGPTYKHLVKSREQKSDIATLVNFSSSSFVISPFLSSSRVETGFPYPAGNFVQKDFYGYHGISDNPNDGLFTSGSWTFETAVKYNLLSKPLLNVTQSIARLCVTGSGISNAGVFANLVAFYDDDTPKLSLYFRSCNSSTAPLLKLDLDLPKEAIFGGDVWNVAFGCQRNDSFNSLASSSYYLLAGAQSDGEIRYYASTSSYFDELSSGTPNDNICRTLDANTNASGTFIALGNGQSVSAGTTSTYLYLNNTTYVTDDAARTTHFDGRIGKTRFWSKHFDTSEWIEHIKNYQSVGVSNPLKNYNYEKILTGSFERLRLDSLSKQETKTTTSTGEITFLDFSENNMHLQGSGFPASTGVLLPEIIYYSYLSPYFDEAISSEKIRVRGYESEDLIEQNPWSTKAPVHEIPRSESPTDDVRFSVDFSLVDSLNRDIANIFSTFESLENMIGSPELVYSPDYPDLEKLRNVYFNRLKEKLNFKAFFEFYRWFDSSISTFIEQLLPKKTVYKGTNFIVESHMLERAKHEYYSADVYVRLTNKNDMSFWENK